MILYLESNLLTVLNRAPAYDTTDIFCHKAKLKKEKTVPK